MCQKPVSEFVGAAIVHVISKEEVEQEGTVSRRRIIFNLISKLLVHTA
jgi:hypothetical protein